MTPGALVQLPACADPFWDRTPSTTRIASSGARAHARSRTCKRAALPACTAEVSPCRCNAFRGKCGGATVVSSPDHFRRRPVGPPAKAAVP